MPFCPHFLFPFGTNTFIFNIRSPVARSNITEPKLAAYVPFITFSIFLCSIFHHIYSSLPVKNEFIDHIRFFFSLTLAQISDCSNSDLIRFREEKNVCYVNVQIIKTSINILQVWEIH